MKRQKSRIIALVISLMMVFVLVAACTPQYETAEPPPATPAPVDPGPVTDEPDEPEPPPAEVEIDNILRFGGQGWDGIFNPLLSNNVYDTYVVDLIFEALITNTPAGEFIPNIAAWEVSNENLTYTFTLTDGVAFSDGVPMTSADVAFTYRTFAHPDYDGVRSYVVMDLDGYDAYSEGETDEFPGIEIIDERTIAFHFAEGTASPANIQNFVFPIIPEHFYAFDTWDDFIAKNSTPLGSGLFVLEEYRDREFIMLSRNLNYWNPAGAAQLDGILMQDIPEESLIGAFQTGQLDIANPVSSPDNYDAFSAMGGVLAEVVTGNSYNFMQFNTTIPQLSDHRVRQALLYALDREAFIEVAYGPFGSVGLSPVSPVSWAFDPAGLNDYAFNMERAAELMEEAGWVMGDDGVRVNGGNRMEITWLVYPEAPWPGILSGLAADTWRQLGVDLTIELMDFVTVGQRTLSAATIGERDFDMYTMGWSMAIDPCLVGGIFGLDDPSLGDGGFNASGWHNAEGQQMMLDARRNFDQAERTRLYNELSAMFNYYVPTVVIALRSTLWVQSDRIQGLELGPYSDWVHNIEQVSLAR